ncbi:MAG: hypothetical protein ABL986_06655 [Vicinamibacterales bacterium]
MSKRILFVLASPEYLRYFDSTLSELAERGHSVSIGVNWLRERKHARLHELISDPRIEILGQIPARSDVWTKTARAVRGGFDYARYLHPTLAEASALRERARRKAVKAAPLLIGLLEREASLPSATLERIYAWLRALESAIPVNSTLVGFLRKQRPDLVVVSPLVDFVSMQVDLIRAAHALGIPTTLSVASWDNLTNKGHLRVVPDAVTVWNAYQREEAVSLHGIPVERISVTGAQLFDRWFERQPSQRRELFCSTVGLPTDLPIVLYTASSIFIARSEQEVPFVRRWLTALRQEGGPGVRDAAVLIRPHPFNGVAWETADFSDLAPVAIWPRARYTPASELSRDGFFDSLYYSDAVVGINTSAMIEASILRKPVLSLRTSDFAGTQDGTLHFRYLLPENGGFLRIASTVGEHLAQLADVLANPNETRQQLDRFVASFIRPMGVAEAATPKLCDALERAAELRVDIVPEALGIRVSRLLLLPAAILINLFTPALDDDGRQRDPWWKRVEPELDRLRKRSLVRPIRLLRKASGWTIRRLRKQGWNMLRWLHRLPSRFLRASRLVRGQFIARLRAARTPSDGPDTHS